MKKVSNILYLLGGLLIALFIYTQINGMTVVLSFIGTLLLSISCFVISIGLVMWRREGYSYLDLLLNLLPSFITKCFSHSKTEQTTNDIGNAIEHLPRK